MDTTLSKYITLAVFFLAIFGSGYWLGHLGKPFNVILFTVHKLIALAAAVFIGVTAYNAARITPLQAGQIAALVAATLLFVLTIAAGGLVSVLAEGKLNSLSPALQSIIAWAHKLLPYLTALAGALALHLVG